jgi:hypothetical protein
MSVKIMLQTETAQLIPLSSNEEFIVKKGLRLIQLVGDELERDQAVNMLRFLGEKIQERPNRGGWMTAKEFFDKYVHHTDDCQKGVTSATCTCGLMANLPHIFSLALEGEELARKKGMEQRDRPVEESS